MHHQAHRGQCGFCQHQLVPGVACDGVNEECPYRLAFLAERAADEATVFSWQLLELSIPGELDAVRGEY